MLIQPCPRPLDSTSFIQINGWTLVCFVPTSPLTLCECQYPGQVSAVLLLTLGKGCIFLLMVISRWSEEDYRFSKSGCEEAEEGSEARFRSGVIT